MSLKLTIPPALEVRARRLFPSAKIRIDPTLPEDYWGIAVNTEAARKMVMARLVEDMLDGDNAQETVQVDR